MNSELTISRYDDTAHRNQVVALWRTVFNYPADYNQPETAIDQKIQFDDLFFVAVEGESLVGTIMAGYDGHRGWIYSMAVHPDQRGTGIGSMLLAFAEQSLVRLGCTKLNLQIHANNSDVVHFYESNGFAVENMISMGKRLG